MKTPKESAGKALEKAAGPPPLDWFRRERHGRIAETSFLLQHMFPHPVQPLDAGLCAVAEEKPPKQEVKAVVLDGKTRKECAFYVIQPFELLNGTTLFAGLRPDPARHPGTGPMRLWLCMEDAEVKQGVVEMETPVVWGGTGEFQLMVTLEPGLAERWREASTEWRTNATSIPFGLVLRPVDEGPGE